jgi:hypothetical protein
MIAVKMCETDCTDVAQIHAGPVEALAQGPWSDSGVDEENALLRAHDGAVSART